MYKQELKIGFLACVCCWAKNVLFFSCCFKACIFISTKKLRSLSNELYAL